MAARHLMLLDTGRYQVDSDGCSPNRIRLDTGRYHGWQGWMLALSHSSKNRRPRARDARRGQAAVAARVAGRGPRGRPAEKPDVSRLAGWMLAHHTLAGWQ